MFVTGKFHFDLFSSIVTPELSFVTGVSILSYRNNEVLFVIVFLKEIPVGMRRGGKGRGVRRGGGGGGGEERDIEMRGVTIEKA